MPGAPTSIVVGGGINAGSPFVLDNFLFVANATPPEAASSPRLIRRADSIEILGDGALSTAIGNNADANGPESIAIGRDCSVASVAATSDVICIGQNMKNTGNVGQAILIGNNVSSNGTGIIVIGSCTSPANANDAVLVGFGVTHSGTLNGVAIGAAANVSGGGNVAIGNGANAQTSGTAIGTSAAALGSNSIAIGNTGQMTGTTSNCISIGSSNRITNLTNVVFVGHNLRTDTGTYAAGDMALGNQNLAGSGFTSRWIFGGDVHTTGVVVPASTFRMRNALGTNIAAGSLTIQAPVATGNAASGSLIFQTAPAGASGAVLQTPTTRLTIDPNGVVTIATPSGAGALSLIVEAAGGAATPSVRLNGLTDGAGAAAGTLTNAPSAGDPSFWIPISIAGAVRYIPCWT